MILGIRLLLAVKSEKSKQIRSFRLELDISLKFRKFFCPDTRLDNF